MWHITETFEPPQLQNQPPTAQKEPFHKGPAKSFFFFKEFFDSHLLVRRVDHFKSSPVTRRPKIVVEEYSRSDFLDHLLLQSHFVGRKSETKRGKNKHLLLDYKCNRVTVKTTTLSEGKKPLWEKGIMRSDLSILQTRKMRN